MSQTENDILNERYLIVEKLINLFRFERLVHLFVTSISLIILFACSLYMIIRKQAGIPELTLMFGSTGLITITANRLFRMWDQALNVIITGKIEK